MADIKINDVPTSVRYIATGGETDFDYTFPIFDPGHLVVQISDPDNLNAPSTLIRGTDYTVAGVGNENGGTITLNPATYPTGASADFVYTLFREMPIARLNDYQFSGDFESSDVNTDFDSVVMMLQQVQRRAEASPSLDVTDELTSLPIKVQTAAERQGRSLRFSDDGTELQAGATETEITAAQGYATTAQAAAVQTNLDKIEAAGSASEAAADAEAVAELLENLTLGPSQAKAQVFTSGFTAGSTTVLPAITVLPIPINEESCNITFYNGTTFLSSPAPDRYSYNSSTGVFTLSDAVPANTTKIVIKWWTSLNIGTPADNSVNWITKMISAGASKIAAWGSDGLSTVLDFITSIGGSPTNAQIPTALAVKNYADGAIAAAVSGIVQYREKVQSTAIGSGVSAVTINFEAGYDYYIKVDDIGPASDSQNLILRFANSGTPVTTSVYRWNGQANSDTAASSYSNSASATYVAVGLSTGNNSLRTVSGEIVIFDPLYNDTLNRNRVGYPNGLFKTRCRYGPSDIGATFDGTFDYKGAASEFNSCVLLWTAGNFRNQGRVTVYREPV